LCAHFGALQGIFAFFSDFFGPAPTVCNYPADIGIIRHLNGPLKTCFFV
jgi:hypothetical protein